ncbi:peptidylprolyl isomerase [Maribacter sp. 2308TA10-17]|uniref:peptidylprolyl isomerase n=1 Tax=Maribacter sp. 2308TA10-17 TaxID=3386276 RepID=UPI0039BD7CEA
MKKVYVLFLVLSLALSGCKSSKYADLSDGLYADIQTTKGDILVKLAYEKTPVTVANFVSLAEGTSTFVKEDLKGKKYYDGLIFHRVMKDFMIQGGDPLGNGTGGPGYKFMDEFHDSLLHDRKGMISMANPGPPDTNGSQFFITHGAAPWLNGKHSIFGEVALGLEVVDSIANTPVGAKNRPNQEMVMNKIEIIRNGKAAKNFDAVEVMTDYFSKEGERLAAIEAEKQAKIAAVNKLKETFAAEIMDQKAKAKTLPSGLKILSLVDSKGEKPRLGSKVLVNYAGFLENGTLFDTSEKEVAEKFGMFEQINQMHRGNLTPSPMDYSSDSPLVPGFREGLLSMKVGDKVRLFFPAHLGWGDQGSGPIPPNSDIVFDVEIMSIVK